MSPPDSATLLTPAASTVLRALLLELGVDPTTARTVNILVIGIEEQTAEFSLAIPEEEWGAPGRPDPLQLVPLPYGKTCNCCSGTGKKMARATVGKGGTFDV